MSTKIFTSAGWLFFALGLFIYGVGLTWMQFNYKLCEAEKPTIPVVLFEVVVVQYACIPTQEDDDHYANWQPEKSKV